MQGGGTITADQAPDGAIIEPLTRSVTGEWMGTGQLYKVRPRASWRRPGRVSAYRRFTAERSHLHGALIVRVVAPEGVDGFGG